MIRMPRDSVTSTTTATTMSTIRVANGLPSWVALLGDERRGALDLQHLDPGAGLEHLILVERAGAPGLTLELHLAAVAVDPFENGRGTADQRGCAGAQLHRRAEVAAGGRPQHQQRGSPHDRENDPLERDPAAGQAD